MRPSQHIDKMMLAVSRKKVQKRRLCLKTSIVSVRWLALQGCAFRGHNESPSSLNRGNFLEMIKFLAEMNREIDKVELDNAPKDAQFIAPSIQKEILHIMANRVRNMIREEVGDECFCILVDDAHDASKQEQIAIMLRFVNSNGILTERFFAIKSVSDTTPSNIKNEISNVLAQHELKVEKMRGQGYDGATNLRGAWNELQTLFLSDCQYAYYVHCFAHQLQLTLVSAAKDVDVIWEFFSHLDNVVNIMNSFPEHINELETVQGKEIEHMLTNGKCEPGSEANQMSNLQRLRTIRWSSYYDSVKNLIDMYDASCKLLEYLSHHCPNGRFRVEVCGVYRNFASFEFVFVLHLMHNIMGITDILCLALQRKSQDILVVMRFVSTTKELLQKLRDDDWEKFLQEVKSFCSRNNIDIPDLDSLYKIGRSRNQITIEHHYHFDVFNKAIDFVLMELNTRFNEISVELISLSVALDPRDSFKSFNRRDICTLAEKFYPQDFSKQDIHTLEYELLHYELDVKCEPRFQVSTLTELCQQLTESRRSEAYIMITRLIRLVLTLPVSIATTERAFSAMKRVKNELRNKMEDDFLTDCMILFIERELAEKIDVDSIIDEFYVSKPQ